jgi:transcription elongation factor GreB
MGDRSENAEYIYGKKRLREIDHRVHFLNKRLEELEVVRETPDRDDRVYFGAWVALEGEDGETLEFRIVGPDEFDPAQRFISMESPMARAVLGKQRATKPWLPRGTGTFTILRAWYPEAWRERTNERLRGHGRFGIGARSGAAEQDGARVIGWICATPRSWPRVAGARLRWPRLRAAKRLDRWWSRRASARTCGRPRSWRR